MTIEQRASADGMIAAKGQVVTIAGASSGTYNPATGTTTTTPYSGSGKAVFFPANPFRKVPNTEIKAGDEQMLLSGLDVDGNELAQPPVGAAVTRADGSRQTIIGVNRLDHDGEGAILYDCVVRGHA